MNYIVSSIPGRIRIRNARLRDARSLAQVQTLLSTLDYIRQISGNRLAGSLLLFYDIKHKPKAAVEEEIDRILKTELGRRPSNLPIARIPMARKKRYTATTLKINRYAKYGMYASLGVSLLAAANGAKRMHVTTGYLFMGCLAVHLATHRHRLIS